MRESIELVSGAEISITSSRNLLDRDEKDLTVIIFSVVVCLPTLIILCVFGWRPTENYLQANGHLDLDRGHSPRFKQFGDRRSLNCRKSLTIGVVTTFTYTKVFTYINSW